MAAIPQTERKLDEARFFLDHLRHADNHRTQRHFISAGLAAARSVTFVFQKEVGSTGKAWYEAWKARLSSDDATFLDVMNKERVAEVHNLGASVSATTEPRTQWTRSSPAENRALLAIEQYAVEENVDHPTHVFKIQGLREAADQMLQRQLKLLETMVSDYRAAHPQ